MNAIFLLMQRIALVHGTQPTLVLSSDGDGSIWFAGCEANFLDLAECKRILTRAAKTGHLGQAAEPIEADLAFANVN
ncbi:MAG: hypothetical protein K2R98_19325 [Gemmataceae bacterium]|nr:hypothetical protein [Gemmataceae bacterium]